METINLSKQQQYIFNKYKKGENLFITGAGGSGKSVLIKAIYQHATENDKRIQVTALTGCAACLLQCKATTIHSWSKIGLARKSEEQIIKSILRNETATEKWRGTNILVVDEVSMMSKKLFDLLNNIAKAVRKRKNEAFGGIQLIFCGDFFQLPPIETEGDPDTGLFCFESEEWDAVFPKRNQIQLEKVFRQKDEVYCSILNQLRKGVVKKKTIDVLESCMGKEYPMDVSVRPTRLYPTKRAVINWNQSKMNELSSETRTHTFTMIYDKNYPVNTKKEAYERSLFKDEDVERELDFIAGNILCEKEVELKIGAQVMCIVNLDLSKEICNGSQGIIKDILENSDSKKTVVVVEFISGHTLNIGLNAWKSEIIPGIAVLQIPLILSWAISIHKSQGTTLDMAEIDIGSNVFECGQSYVALSRVKSLEGLYLKGFDINKIKVLKKVKKYYEDLTEYDNEHPVNLDSIADDTYRIYIHKKVQVSNIINTNTNININTNIPMAEAHIITDDQTQTQTQTNNFPFENYTYDENDSLPYPVAVPIAVTQEVVSRK
jgi:ATP-dependent DNA helicase PIF1